MQEKFNQYLEQELSVAKKDSRILLAVSGGMDSVAMLHLFLLAGYEIGVAHVNFQLREAESERDEKFVQELAATHELPFYTQQFDTKRHADQHGISIQMAARELRYNWFEELRIQHQYDWIALGHHQDDQVETFFINLLRGTGLTGLSGIKRKNNSLIRPMLCFEREEIVAFMKKNLFQYREDSSNQSTHYLRNALRLEIIPALEKLNPALQKTILNEMNRFEQINTVYKQSVKEKIDDLLVHEPNDAVRLPKAGLQKLDPLYPYLYEYLRQVGFNATQVDDVVKGIGSKTHAEFLSETHRLVREKDNLVLLPLNQKEKNHFSISLEDNSIDLPIAMQMKIAEKSEVMVTSNKSMAFIDYDQLNFPLQLRKWKNGDFFYPLGMHQRKKLSDYFIDEKYSVLEKEETWLLTSGDDIVWIVGGRIDDRYKVSNNTQKIFTIRLLHS